MVNVLRGSPARLATRHLKLDGFLQRGGISRVLLSKCIIELCSQVYTRVSGCINERM